MGEIAAIAEIAGDLGTLRLSCHQQGVRRSFEVEETSRDMELCCSLGLSWHLAQRFLISVLEWG